MEKLIHRAPSVGSVTKKILTLHPHLTAQQIIDILRQSMAHSGKLPGEFVSAEIIDEVKALEMARSLNTSQ